MNEHKVNMEFDKEKIDRYYEGAESFEDESYLAELFDNDRQVDRLKSHLSGQFSKIPAEEDVAGKDFDQLLYKIHYTINSRAKFSRPSRFIRSARIALSLAGALLIPLVIFMGLKQHSYKAGTRETLVEITAPAWTRARFVLPDGTTGWLNSNSSIIYKGNYRDDRQVVLTGEAYFDVAKDPKRPFVVTTPDIRALVLGTRFNLSSYGNENTVELVLEEGKLEFSDSDGQNASILKPDDLVTYNKLSKEFKTTQVQAQKYTAWTSGKLVFRNDPLDVVARRLARWYNVDVELDTNQIDDLRWRATFVDDNLEEVLSALKRSLHVDYSIEKSSMNPDNTFPRKKIKLTVKRK
jgi:transmembrane sensor